LSQKVSILKGWTSLLQLRKPLTLNEPFPMLNSKRKPTWFLQGILQKVTYKAICLYECTCACKRYYQPFQTLGKSKTTVQKSPNTHDYKVINLFTEDHQALNH